MTENTAHSELGSDNWPITTERFVAFIDIMGFKDMVSKRSHEEVYKLMQKIDNAKSVNENIGATNDSPSLVRTTTYSDSIMLYSKNNTDKSFSALVISVSGLTNDLFLAGIPHKGAIAYGLMTLDNKRSIFFGQPLIDAYLLQDELHFYGVIIHGSVEEKLQHKINSTPFVRNFECFLKGGKTNHFTIYPMHIDSQSAKEYPGYHQNILDSLEKMRYKTSGHLRRYIDNTTIYFKFVNGH